MSAAELARQLGMNRSNISQWFKAKDPASPPVRILGKIAEILRIQVSDLFAQDLPTESVISEADRLAQDAFKLIADRAGLRIRFVVG